MAILKDTGPTRLAAVWPRYTVLCLASPLLLPLQAAAEGDWQANIGVRSEYTDNANRVETNKLSERQDEVELGLGGDYANRWVTFEAGYSASERRFSKDSQEDRSLLEGDSELVIGQPTDPLDLVLSHSRRTVLNAPDDIDLLSNNDERTIFSAMPSARWRPTGVDLVMVRGQFSDVDYRFRPERNSERRGGSLVVQRDLSEISSLSLTGQHTEIAFDDAPQADYQYRAANLSYQVNLRQLQYQVQVGYNETSPESGGAFSSPTFLVDVQLAEGASRWNFNASQFITDNSTGSGNAGDLGGFTPGDSSSGELDQLERTRAEIGWSNERLCMRCTASASVYWQSDDFRLTIDNQDRDELGIRFLVGYQISRQSSMDISFQRRDQTFKAGAIDRGDYQEDRVRASYEYNFANPLALNLFLAHNKRKSDNGSRGYDENVGGLGLRYTF